MSNTISHVCTNTMYNIQLIISNLTFPSFEFHLCFSINLTLPPPLRNAFFATKSFAGAPFTPIIAVYACS